MNYNRKDILVGLVIVVVVVLGVLLFKKLKTAKVLSTPVPQEISFKNDIEDSFKFDIPDNVKTTELKDVSGSNGRGIATSTEVLADIEDPVTGYFYEAWLQGSNNQDLISLGKLRIAKGGWLLEYEGSKYPEYKKIIISLEKVFDSNLEKRILEGTF
ncbi:hypothetical protein A2130_00165 [Candidatus Woesebacteria bacterium GWC2_33_12]|uniref:Uncharacterized protein n=1 Tax=Candidatus Woesebacteria bacterium GW2011_GWB1_33_22 TaxID=1618566 RepID=A0A0G0CN01_9BACT|nr:MAG: hypothetical protein UR29_C0010G0023 [Candidatus Woesebacteria bacterium GW2011_GWC2_33_12]KKP42048.1 MAG: hypothetical protein UR33_C0006G0032 [Candidatus Woesebacteria bacterium GW2011_GWA2_33_20]KKP44802.1 MAG: hypothetical protein UR35_C0006G0037 [Candidatus Woesebacteria bacterium GW2011_GWB1_33_22]KKP46621.1 MAG: hypothetical protein UR37_C0006G0071 [Microgenomates group bacterium GW2011_GWC1_33_28]KKP50534.1 MAG: hypothetical protein UR41_C0006G0037 [Candidatus Woesebacteria bact